MGNIYNVEIGEVIYDPSCKRFGWVIETLPSDWYMIEWADGDKFQLTGWNISGYRKELTKL